jgi:hypothetical protein
MMAPSLPSKAQQRICHHGQSLKSALGLRLDPITLLFEVFETDPQLNEYILG